MENQPQSEQQGQPAPILGAEVAKISELHVQAVTDEDKYRSRAEASRSKAASGIGGIVGGVLSEAKMLEADAHMNDLYADRAGADANNRETKLSLWLNHTREKFEKYTPEQASEVEKYFVNRRQEGGAMELFDAWRKDAGSADWKTFIASDATDEQLTNILQWHSSRMDQVNKDPEILRRIELLKRKFMSGVDEMAANDIVDETMPDRAYEKTKTVKVAISDVFDLQVKGRVGYTRIDGNTIFLGEDLNPEDYYHEMLHQVITEEIRNTGWNGMRLLKAIIDEAVVDNLAMSIHYRGGSSRFAFEPNRHIAQTYIGSKQLMAYKLSDRYIHGYTEDDFVRDYTGPKKLYRTFLHSRAADTAKQNLNREAKRLQEEGATSHSAAFDMAAHRVFRSEVERDQRYEAGRRSASQVVRV